MTLEQIKNRIEEIKKFSKFDSEAAHTVEDDLYRDFVEYIAHSSNVQDLVEKARLISTTKSIRFPRWSA